MEFEGRIRNVMPARTGTSQRGEWKALPFVFEYKELPTDPYYDSVLLETFDTNIINGIESCCQKDAEGHLMMNNNELMLTRDIYVRIGFRHKAKVYVPKDTTQPARFINEIRINSIQAIHAPQQTPAIGQQQPQAQPAQKPAQQPQGNVLGGPQTPPYNPYAPQPQASAPFPPAVDQYGNPITDGGQGDDLPF